MTTVTTDLRSGLAVVRTFPAPAAPRPEPRPRLVVLRVDRIAWMAVVFLAAWFLG